MNNLIGVSGQIKVGKDLVGEMLQYIGDVKKPNYGDFQKYVDFNSKYKIKKYADKLKDCLCVILGCTRKELEDRDFKERVLGKEWWVYKLSDGTLLPRGYYPNPIDNKICEERYLVKLTPRLILQLFGTEGSRMIIHPNIWVNALFSDYKGKRRSFVRGQYIMKCNDCQEMFHDAEKQQPWCLQCSSKTDYPNWIITDVRFPENEGKAVLSRGGLMIGVKRLFKLRFPEYAGLDASGDGYDIPKSLEKVNSELYENLTHKSESSMGDHSWCDVIIENNGTMEELFNNVLNAVQPNY